MNHVAQTDEGVSIAQIYPRERDKPENGPTGIDRKAKEYVGICYDAG